LKIIRSLSEMSGHARERREQGCKIALVPTMGYLHLGHLSLMRIARQYAEEVVTSIFVNPIQFGPREDLSSYPRDPERDQKLAAEAGTATLFIPADNDMYPQGFQSFVDVEKITQGLCGRSRPGHFRGVATVVAKLFNIVQPHYAVFGQKDAQQVAVIRRMVADLNMPVEIIIAPIVREPDGLAMSSRNVYLSGQERQDALVLYRSLAMAQEMIQQGEREPQAVISRMTGLISAVPSSRIDYIEIVDAASLEPVQRLAGELLLALAVYIGRTRLIDNCLVTVEKEVAAL